MRLNREQFLKAGKGLKIEDVPCPELSTPELAAALGIEPGAEISIGIRTLTAAGRAVFIKRSMEVKEKKKDATFEIEMLLVAMTSVDDKEAALFTEEDVAIIGNYSAAVIARCAEVAQRLSGLNPGAQAEAGKPSGEAPSPA